MATTTVNINFDVTVDNATISYIRAAFGGGTNQQTLDAVKAWAKAEFMRAFWPYVVKTNCDLQRATDTATMLTNEATLRATIEGLPAT